METAQQISPAYRKLQQQTSKATNEEEVRLAWVRALEQASGITFDAERGKRDLSYNNVVIEFKDLGKFNGKTSSPAFREAMEERLLPYILRAAKADHIDERDYIGIANRWQAPCLCASGRGRNPASTLAPSQPCYVRNGGRSLPQILSACGHSQQPHRGLWA